MNLEPFLRARQPEWNELDELVRRARGRPERLGPDGVRRLGALYRSAVADLARARREFGADPSVRRLEQVVGRARATLYATSGKRGSGRSYLIAGYWRDVRDRWRIVVLAWVLLLGSAALATVWGLHDPAAAAGVVPGSLAGGGSGPQHAIGLGASQSAALSVSIFTNNIGVTFLSFAAGIVFGILPAFLLAYNGLILGAVVGIAAGTGHAIDAVELIAPHGVLELSCIAVSAAAGMRMGWALVEPGPRPRGEALAAEAPRAVIIVLCTAPWLVLAGLTEGFVTPHHLPLAAAIAVGVGLAAPYWAGVIWLGRHTTRAGPAHSREVALAVR
ncbi:MAG: stage II sporulation protein M [Solirubrobacteraceae bacterium]